MKIYFCHPINTYNTIVENYVINFIEKLIPDCEIINPNQIEFQERYKIEGMSTFLNIIDNCDRIYVLPFYDDTIGSGQIKEIEYGLSTGKRVIILKLFSQLEEIWSTEHLSIMNIQETRKKLKESMI